MHLCTGPKGNNEKVKYNQLSEISHSHKYAIEHMLEDALRFQRMKRELNTFIKCRISIQDQWLQKDAKSDHQYNGDVATTIQLENCQVCGMVPLSKQPLLKQQDAVANNFIITVGHPDLTTRSGS